MQNVIVRKMDWVEGSLSTATTIQNVEERHWVDFMVPKNHGKGNTPLSIAYHSKHNKKESEMHNDIHVAWRSSQLLGVVKKLISEVWNQKVISYDKDEHSR